MAQKRSTFKLKKPLIIGFILILLVGVWGFLRYQQSSKLLELGDQLLKQGESEQAIRLYNQAHNTFPFRTDVINSLKGAELVQKSEGEFSKISEVDAEIENAELQNVPEIANLPPEQALKSNELLVPILMYHHIRVNPRPGNALWASLNVSPEQLDAQFQYLSAHNFHPISMDQLLDALKNKSSLPSKPIVLSFDDGYRNFYESAFPLLKKYNFKAIEFVITDVSSFPAYLRWDQILEMDKSGLVEFGAHTRHHPSLTSLSSKTAADEIKGSKQDLESHLKKPIKFFAYPYGNYNDSIIKMVQDAGYQAAASVIYGSIQSDDKLFVQPRVMVDGRFSLQEFGNRLPK